MSDQVITPVVRAGLSIPDYELLRPIGRGAYGEVWLARNVTGSWVALKIVHRSAFDHDRPFEREFEGIKRFEPISRSDPSQVAILHVGLGDGFFYYVMELADDVAADVRRLTSSSAQPSTLSSQPDSQRLFTSAATYQPKTLKRLLNDRGALPAHECLAIALSLTRALALLHGHGLVHRDVKLSNVIFVNGQAKLADIGLVTSVDATRSFVGTEGYLPPEGAGTPQADLYSLGKVLYEMSTGCDRKEFPALPPDIATRPDRNILAELNAIVVRASQLDPRERYQSAEEMRADLERLRGGKSVRQAHQVKLRWRLVRRGTGSLAVAAVALTLIALASRVWLAPANPESSKRSTNSVANDQYDLGRSLYQKNTQADTAKAAEYFQAAVNADTNFALAQAAQAAAWSWADVGTNHNWALLSRAKEIAERALAKDDSLSDAYLALAMHAWIMEWDWPKTEKCFKRALKCDPQNPQPHEWYGQFLRTMGRTNDAIRELEIAVNINPRSETGIRFLGLALLSARRYSEAVGRQEKAVEMQTDFHNLWSLGEALRWGGQIERSITVLARAAELNGSDPTITAARTEALTRALHEGGEAAFCQKQFEFVREETSDPLELAEACASVGRSEEALDLLERAYREHHVFLVWNLKAHPEWDSLRGQRRFKALLKKLRLD